MSALRGIFDCGLLKDLYDISYPVIGRSATFSATLKALQNLMRRTSTSTIPFPSSST
jgi:hypothetical protein